MRFLFRFLLLFWGVLLLRVPTTYAYPDEVLEVIPLSVLPLVARLSPSGRFLYVADATAGQVSVVDTLSFSEMADVSFAGVPRDMAMNDDGSALYVITHVRDEVVVFDEYGPVRMIRDHEWKYVRRYPDGPDELYHLSKDPDERTNLVDESRHRHVVDDMRQRMEKWFARYVDPSRDGAAQPVRGKGQIAAVDTSSAGPPAFAQEPGAIL